MTQFRPNVPIGRLFPLFSIVLALLLTACGGGDSGSSDVSSTQLSATPNPASNTIINASTPIVIGFNQSTDVSTLALGGSLAAESDGGVWSSNSLSNDTLTISPLTAWSESAGATITVSVSNDTNDSSVSLSYTYPVDATAPVVSLTPASNATISLSSQIVIQFDESMDTYSLVLSGAMESESDGGVWSTTTNANDTLTISATTLWSSNQLSIDVNDVAGNAVATLVFSFTLDSSAPTALVTPENGSLLANASTITITFSETMDTSSLVLSGDLSSEDDGGIWSTDTYTNDTLTISPASEWTVGMGRTFVINASDIGGNPISEINLSYDTSAVYVSTLGDDNWTGTSSAPKKTVQSGIDFAQSLGIKDVLIQAGTYAAVIDMKPGINVTGGYDTSWTYESYKISAHNVILVGDFDVIWNESLTVKAHGINTPTLLKNLTVQGPNATANPYGYGNSSYAIHTIDSSGMNLSDISIVAGNGASGQSGSGSSDASQTAATGGGAGGSADEYSSSCDNTSRGVGGAAVGTGSLASGGGGNGGTMDTDCTFTFPTYKDLNATAGNSGDSAAIFITNFYGDGGDGGSGVDSCGPAQNGYPGTPGALGVGGSGGSLAHGSTLSSFYMPATASAGYGGYLGSDGAGGGGGGGSGGCDTGTDSYGAGGGGGGAGGVKSSLAGGGGQSGGSSFGIYVVNSTMQVTDTSIARGTGGTGGAGASGGLGQPGGNGGSGGASVGDSQAGGDGGDGGLGGSSGSGGGGAGGNSYGIFSDSSTVTESLVLFSGGTGGTSGAGGSRSGTSSGSAGSTGSVYGTIIAP